MLVRCRLTVTQATKVATEDHCLRCTEVLGKMSNEATRGPSVLQRQLNPTYATAPHLTAQGDENVILLYTDGWLRIDEVLLHLDVQYSESIVYFPQCSNSSDCQN